MAVRIRDAAAAAYPNEKLAQGEILRRFSLEGVAALKAASDAAKRKAQWEAQATQTVAEPKADRATASELC